jgi:tetratricopeptide (TPR) repeat protein
LLAFGELHCGRLIEAEQAAERGLAEYPTSLDFHYVRCYVKTALGEFEAAIEAAQTFLSLRDAMKSSRTAVEYSSTGAHPGRLLDLLGTAYRESGKLREAEDAYKRAMKAEAKSHLPYLNLAQLYFRTGRKVEAAEVVAQGLKHCSQVQELRMLRDSFRTKSSVSACMIVRNEEESLGRCLDSIRDWVDEIIVVDTGSTDGTVSRSLTERGYYISRGKGISRNIAIIRSTRPTVTGCLSSMQTRRFVRKISPSYVGCWTMTTLMSSL